MDHVILGDGPLGRAIETALSARGDAPRILGRPRGGRHAADDLLGARVVFDASRGTAVAANVEDALLAGSRAFVIATTGWDTDRERVEQLVVEAGAAAVVAPNLSLGAALFLRLLERASTLFGSVGEFDPYVMEWHRREKRDRPSGTAREIVRRLGAPDLEVAVIRAGASPGMHLVGFDSPGETIELRLTARDRSAYAAGALASADWLLSDTRAPGFHRFDAVVDDLLVAPQVAATA
jgi:4-hydroxy-tetrahydrodipicolinate reductase